MEFVYTQHLAIVALSIRPTNNTPTVLYYSPMTRRMPLLNWALADLACSPLWAVPMSPACLLV